MNFFSTLPTEVFDAIGVAGFGLYVLNYILLTVQKVDAEQITYFALNLAAASMVMIGLFAAFNLASAMIQIFWIAISIYAIATRLKKHRSRTTAKAPGATLHATETQVLPPSAERQRPAPRLPGAFPKTYSQGPGSAQKTQPHAMG